jgi:hypothetical protein
MEEKTKAPFWKPALLYGVVVAFVGILLGIIFYIMDLYTASWTQWVSLAISLAVVIYCAVHYRKEHLGGYASYGKMWTMIFVIGIISTLITTLYTYILMGVIDPELIDKMKLAAEQKILNNPRIPENIVDRSLERLDKSMQLGRMITMGLISGPIVWALLGLVIAAFVKKNDPAENMA